MLPTSNFSSLGGSLRGGICGKTLPSQKSSSANAIVCNESPKGFFSSFWFISESKSVTLPLNLRLVSNSNSSPVKSESSYSVSVGVVESV
ncbi:hypothetical protein VIGAN_03049400 [Vigna angularis var. angularis]|uniref:Uncharacterized protein n=1 Tax=Vigna angularis var. angularis TaxID=157739 RepID=A0A0S3RK35_PHAAN|nr:hypothetical protein VIGAN_03049400 [Vigna angularis var. angularis]